MWVHAVLAPLLDIGELYSQLSILKVILKQIGLVLALEFTFVHFVDLNV